MRFTRRTESINAARLIFKRAREDRRSGSAVYKAAAFMEYYCSKDINIACKVFELGLKKFPADVPFIVSYIDFLHHLNEENNIRVLFERVLSSESLPLEKSLEIWNKFLEFESQIGDLPSVVKVETRRAAVLEKLAQQQPNQQQAEESAWVMDRYRFGNLMPCSMQVLKSIGYARLVAGGGTSSAGSGDANFLVDLITGTKGETEEKVEHKPSLAMPNLTQVVPFKPVPNPVANLMPGGIFPYPPSVMTLLAQLPPPQSFYGPFVAVDELIQALLTTTQVNLSKQADCVLPPKEAKAFLLKAAEAAESFGQGGGGGGGTKRMDRSGGGGGGNAGQASGGGAGQANVPMNVFDDDEDGEGSNSMPAQFDIFRSRQMNKKLKV